MSQALRDARRYEEGIETYIKPEDRPGFHLSARVGWMNDPNGFSFYMGTIWVSTTCFTSTTRTTPTGDPCTGATR